MGGVSDWVRHACNVQQQFQVLHIMCRSRNSHGNQLDLLRCRVTSRRLEAQSMNKFVSYLRRHLDPWCCRFRISHGNELDPPLLGNEPETGNSTFCFAPTGHGAEGLVVSTPGPSCACRSDARAGPAAASLVLRVFCLWCSERS